MPELNRLNPSSKIVRKNRANVSGWKVKLTISEVNNLIVGYVRVIQYLIKSSDVWWQILLIFI